MDPQNAEDMDALDITDFLAAQETGVLSLADGNDAYAVPVSFYFQPDDQQLYFRLGFAPGSQKQKFLERTDLASFVVHGRADGRWKSVVASGRLEIVETEQRLDDPVLEAVQRLEIPYFRVFDRPTDEIEFGIYRLRAESLKGIVEGRG
ncbi:pyridoxamine 5'-phosphate oxidase family protein [Halapricum salinum]|uniref:Pyridoxamine 5'-phosphate oxidase family protein n=1 Tax=Halapricum salinum TaxID=1457250 RepID=A0A4D6HBP7_9EURY|nr:pyridoxamine 5'-phosphate oxidase family protein [Halapricum salinum]QCC50167.1 pyridoxamine 5'-phosphate oxidase family protein [Halapricum salinum]